jgi:metallo-beta-lactamase class B VIM
MLRVALFLLLFVLMTGCQSSYEAATEAPALAKSADIELHEVRDGVWVHTSYYTYPGGARFPSNGLLIQEGDSLLLVDTAWGERLSVGLLDTIEREVGLPVYRAIITHSHYDRLAGADVLEERGIDVLAHPLSQKQAMELGTPVPDDTLRGLGAVGNSVPVGSVEVLYPGPGHAPDNLMVWVPDRRVLFGGCAVRSAASTSLGNTAHADLASWPEAIRLAQTRYPAAEMVVPGHGAVGGPELLRHTLDLFER